MSQETGEQEQQTSKYNSAVEQLKRIGGLWDKAHTRSLQGDLQGWNKVLDKIWSELARDLTNPDDPQIKKFNNFVVKLGETGKLGHPEIKGFSKISNPKANEQYLIILEKEIWLGRLQNKLGKGTSWADEDEDDID
jgi:hypothetical protein